MRLLTAVIDQLANEKALDPKYRDHSLSGEYSDSRECHIRPDWLLIYRVDRERLVLIEQRTGTHSDLFDE